MPEELDIATADDVAERAYAAIAGGTRLLLLDLTGVSFCDARGLSAFARIANRAQAAGCRYGLIAPRPQVAKVLRISGLDTRIPVFSTIGDAVANQPATTQSPWPTNGAGPLNSRHGHAAFQASNHRAPHRGVPA